MNSNSAKPTQTGTPHKDPEENLEDAAPDSTADTAQSSAGAKKTVPRPSGTPTMKIQP